MSDVTMKLDRASVATRTNGPATAVIWLDFDGHGFPSAGWRDFAVVVLGWYVVAVSRLLRKESDREIAHFMDGPYAVEITQPATGEFRFRALNDSLRKDEVAVGEARAVPFVRCLLLESRELLAICEAKGWWSADAEKLRDSLRPLEAAVSQLIS